MAAKLSDAEFIERARASAKRRADRQRLRKIARQLAERGIVTATGNLLSKDTIGKTINRAGLTAHCTDKENGE